MIHRDLKPSNIMIEQRPDGSVLPGRDGLWTGAGEAGDGKGAYRVRCGHERRPLCLPSKHAEKPGTSIAARMYYSLGATLFDVLTGHAPFESETVVDVILSVMNEEAPLLRTLAASTS